MELDTRTLIGRPLDVAVAMALGLELTTMHVHFRRIAGSAWSEEKIAEHLSKMDDHPVHIDWNGNFAPIAPYSTNWAVGGPLLDGRPGLQMKEWAESKPESKCEVHIHNLEGDWIAFGPTLLVAAMRCIVAYRLGDKVTFPFAV